MGAVSDRKRSVLVVDDDELSREVLSVILGAGGYQVGSAESGDDAVRLLTASTTRGSVPDLILTDLQMPGLAGIELAESLRRFSRSTTKILAISAAKPKPSLLAGFDGFLQKPFSIQDLEQALGEMELSPIVAASKMSILDEDVYARLGVTMSAEKVVEMYRLCLTDALSRLGKMRSAVLFGDDAELRREAHTLRGGCGMLGATEIRILAAKLEEVGLHGRTSVELEAHLDLLAGACERLQGMLESRWGRESKV